MCCVYNLLCHCVHRLTEVVEVKKGDKDDPPVPEVAQGNLTVHVLDVNEPPKFITNYTENGFTVLNGSRPSK